MGHVRCGGEKNLFFIHCLTREIVLYYITPEFTILHWLNEQYNIFWSLCLDVLSAGGLAEVRTAWDWDICGTYI